MMDTQRTGPVAGAGPAEPVDTVRVDVYIRRIDVYDDHDPGAFKGEYDVHFAAEPLSGALDVSAVRWEGSVSSGKSYEVARWTGAITLPERESRLTVVAGGVEHDPGQDDALFGGLAVLTTEQDLTAGTWWRTTNGKDFDFVFAVVPFGAAGGDATALPEWTGETRDAPGPEQPTAAEYRAIAPHLPTPNEAAWRAVLPELFNARPVVSVELDRPDGDYALGDVVRATIAAATDHDVAVRQLKAEILRIEEYAVSDEELKVAAMAAGMGEMMATPLGSTDVTSVAECVLIERGLLRAGAPQTFTAELRLPSTGAAPSGPDTTRLDWVLRVDMDRAGARDVAAEIQLSVGAAVGA